MKLLVSSLLLLLGSVLFALQLPHDHQVIDGAGTQVGGACSTATPEPISRYLDTELTLLVWNVQKHRGAKWQTEFTPSFDAAELDLLLLQEAPLLLHDTQPSWHWQQSVAFLLDDIPLGVATGSIDVPLSSCGLWHREPWLGTNKTALVSSVVLHSGDTLLIINLHGVNFSWDMQPYQHQLEALFALVRQHRGPVIMAGDFNSWRTLRQSYLREATQALGLQPVIFSPDRRTRFLGQPLDHLFYRDLKLVQAQTFLTKNSDHAPLLAKFVIE